MSTQINVTVDSGGLRQRDQQQRHALRLGKLESDNQRKVEARATDARTAELRNALLGADGKPLYGAPTPATARREEPAAFRAGKVYEWSLEPTAATQTGTDQFTAVTKNAKVKPLVFIAVVVGGAPSTPDIGGPTSGPGGTGYSLRNTSRGADLRATSTDFQMDGKPDFTFESYVKLNGVQVPNSLMQVKHYVWVLGSNYSDQGSSSNRRHYLTIEYEKWTDRDGILIRYDRYTTSGATYFYNRLTNTSTIDPGIWTATPGFNVVLNPGEWFHLAITRKSQVIYFFINGQLAAYGSDAAGPSDIAADKVTINGVTDYQVTSSEVSMAKTRFIRKALYTNNFTPP